MLLTGSFSFSQSTENQEKKAAELKASSEVKEGKSEKKPELKAYDATTTNAEKRKKENSGTPELKAISNQ